MDKREMRMRLYLANEAVKRAQFDLERHIAMAVEGGCSVREVAQDLKLPAATAQRRIAKAVAAWEPHKSPGVGR